MSEVHLADYIDNAEFQLERLVPRLRAAELSWAEIQTMTFAYRQRGVCTLLLTGIHLSVSAAIGFIALFGQAVLNGVVMVSYFNELRDEGLSAYQSVVQGAMVRLRTVLMTSLLAMLGLLPMALSHGIGSEVQRPLATVIIGGLISATGLTLILLPVIYLALEARRPDLSRR